MISAIIPAFNEQATVGQVVKVVKKIPQVSEIIVVDDGSKDNTARAASQAGAQVIKIPYNQGKGRALSVGVANSSQPFLLFLDADLVGLTQQHLETLINPVVGGRTVMSIGTIDKKTIERALERVAVQLFAWSFGGLRIMTRNFWEQIPENLKQDFGIESVLNHFARRQRLPVKIFLLSGLNHVIKEKKQGFLTGFINRLKMFGQIARTFALLKLKY